MTIPINMTLYRLLVQLGASEADAEAAASVDASQLVTKADLLATKSELLHTIAELKSSVIMWLIGMFLAQTTLILAVLRLMRP